MQLSFTAAACILAFAGSVAADALCTITPCANCPPEHSPPPITVTSQYQPVSTCKPTSFCIKGHCETQYPWETYQYVSTVIPVWKGTQAEQCTVTQTEQLVTVSEWRTTSTEWVTPTPKWPHEAPPAPTPVYHTKAREYCGQYSKLGPLAIPGWGGSELCESCFEHGSPWQELTVTECEWTPSEIECFEFTETWVAPSAPSTVWVPTATCSSHFWAPTVGVYTFTFPQWMPAVTIVEEEVIWTAPAQPWFAEYTHTCTEANQWWDFTTTVTKTVTQTCPFETKTPTR